MGTDTIAGFMGDLNRDFRARASEGDFYGSDGLLRCGRCGTPKECRISAYGAGKLGFKGVRWVPGKDISCIRPTMCECEAGRLREEEERHERAVLLASARAERAKSWDIEGLERCTFDADDMADPAASGAARRYADGFDGIDGRGLILMGGVGCGKTFLAACIANELSGRGVKVRVTSLTSLCQKMTGNYRSDFTSTLSGLKSRQLVVLDDLGSERRTQTATECAYEVVNALYTARVPMVVTTNLTPAEMKRPGDVESDRIYSRIIERCELVVMSSRDRRKK